MIVNEHEYAILELLVKYHELDLKSITDFLELNPENAGTAVSNLIEKKYAVEINSKFILTKEGTDFYKKSSKKRKIFEKKEIYDIEPAGGINLEIGLVYEPIQRNEMVYNWMGKKGISPIQVSGDKRMYFKIGETKFILDKPSINDDICWTLPDYEVFEKWSIGKIKSKSIWELYEKTKIFCQIFFDTGTESYHTLLFLAGLQSWFAPYLPARFFVEAIGGFSGGKTTILDLLECFCRHGYLVGNQTTAFVGRSLKNYKLTSLCDEFDVHCEEDPELMALVRSSQRKGHYARATMKGGIESFETKGSFYYTVHGEIDRALSSRAMPIYTTKTDLIGMGKINLIKNSMGKELLTEWFLWYMDNAVDRLSKIQITMPNWTTLEKMATTLKKESNISENTENGKLLDGCSDGCSIEATRKPDAETLSIENSKRVVVREEKRIYIYRKALLSLVSEQPWSLGNQNNLVAREEELSAILSMILSCLYGQPSGQPDFSGQPELLEKIKNDIYDLFEIKKTRSEEFTETGIIGDVRNTIVKFYEKNKRETDYRVSNGEFIVPNKELKIAIYENFKAQGKFVPSDREFSSIMRDLGFEEKISRKKMKCRTKEGRDTGEDKEVLLCNILTPKVCNRIGIKYDALLYKTDTDKVTKDE